MLNIIGRGGSDRQPCVLLLGGFDGIHIGHQALFSSAKEYRLPIGLTSIYGEKAGGDIFTVEERRVVFAECGASFVYELPFDEGLKNTSAEDFLREILRAFDVKALLCGEDFRFGKGAQGTPAILKNAAPCPVEVLPLCRMAGEKVSSTAVKRFIEQGDLPAANKLLSTPFFLQGYVEHGRRVGRTLGFPTVNLTYPKGKFPVKQGVYSGTVSTEQGVFGSIINFGARPTFGVTEQKAEAWLSGFSGDLYGQTVRLFPQRFLRPVQKFESVAALTAQLEKDKESLL